MGFVDKFKGLVGIEEFDEDYIEEEAVESMSDRRERSRSSFENRRAEQKQSEPKVLSMQRGSTVNTHPFKMVVLEPKGFEEAPKLVDNLRSRKPVIVNLEKLESDTAKKVFDFLSGATYALGGNVQKVASNIFIFAPDNVDINSSVEHKGFDFNQSSSKKW